MKRKKLSNFLKKIEIFAAVFLISVLYGCKANPAEGCTTFLAEFKKVKMTKRKLVDKAWIKPGLDITKYKKVILTPVLTKYHLEYSWLERNNVRTLIGSDKEDLKDFAKYTEDAFKKAIKESNEIKLTSRPGPKTLILELALVKIVPGKPILQGLGDMTNFTPFGAILIPVKTTAKATTDSPLQGSVAIEGIIRDSETKEPLIVFSDREKQVTAIFNANDFRAYSNLKQIVDTWAIEFVYVMENGTEKGAEEQEIFTPVNF